jgi:hypothetical protein
MVFAKTKAKLLIGFIKSQTKLLWNLNRSRQNLTNHAAASLLVIKSVVLRLVAMQPRVLETVFYAAIRGTLQRLQKRLRLYR